MNDTCRVLLICDDSRLGLELRQMLGRELRVAPLRSGGDARVIPLDVDEVALSGTWELGFREQRYHLGIVAITEASPMAELVRHPTLLSSLAAALHLVSGMAAAATHAILRPGRDHALDLPCTRAAMLYEVERTLLSVLDQEAPADHEVRTLGFLRTLVEADVRSIQPQPSAKDPAGWTYPLLNGYVASGAAQGALLDRLVEQGLCVRNVALRARVCPSCTSHQLSYGESCGRCGSPDFVREPIIHHFACAHMDTQQAFTQGDALVCPKCRAILRQIGRDYEKPASCYKCQSCAYISAETRISALCLWCRVQTAPEATVERLVHAYALTSLADEAVAANDLAGHSMESVLRHAGTGLHAKRFFVFSLEHELERLRRYGHPLSLVVLRSTGLSELRATRRDLYDLHAQALWQAASAGLRTLDMVCVWEEGMLAIMLPATPVAGADVVLQRIAERIDADAAVSGAVQEVVIVTVAASTKHADAQAIMAEAIAALASPPVPAATASDLLVLSDDEETLDVASANRAGG